jgi:hypothetical protein
MAVTEEECFAARLRRLIEEDNPQFEYYDNAQRNFDDYDLLDSLASWERQRKSILDRVRDLSQEDVRRVGRHAVYGELNVIGLLQLMLQHDEEHKAQLDGLLEQYCRTQS